MSAARSIQPIAAEDTSVLAFRVSGQITDEDMKAMAETVNAAFDQHDSVSMLLIFDGFEGSEFGAGWNMESVKAQLRSIGKVDQYLVVGAPDAAESMIEGFGRLLPVRAETFDREAEAEAWARVGTRPAAT